MSGLTALLQRCGGLSAHMCLLVPSYSLYEWIKKVRGHWHPKFFPKDLKLLFYHQDCSLQLAIVRA